MKIIFLDIDGVLNLMRPEFDEFGQLFHDEFVNNLKYIIDKTGAKIVISSTWRFSGLSTMKKMWKKRGLPGEVIDITPSDYQVFESKKFPVKDLNDVLRGHEIQFWLDHYDNIESYVILDDDTDFLKTQLDNFVKTSDNPDHHDSLDIGYGLTTICSKKSIKILNG